MHYYRRYKSEPNVELPNNTTISINLNKILSSIRNSTSNYSPQKQKQLKLPQIKEQTQSHLNSFELNDISLKVLKLKKLYYDPTGCSKSIRLEKVLLRKKMMRSQKLSPLIKRKKSKNINSIDDYNSSANNIYS